MRNRDQGQLSRGSRSQPRPVLHSPLSLLPIAFPPSASAASTTMLDNYTITLPYLTITVKGNGSPHESSTLATALPYSVVVRKPKTHHLDHKLIQPSEGLSRHSRWPVSQLYGGHRWAVCQHTYNARSAPIATCGCRTSALGDSPADSLSLNRSISSETITHTGSTSRWIFGTSRNGSPSLAKSKAGPSRSHMRGTAMSTCGAWTLSGWRLQQRIRSFRWASGPPGIIGSA